MPLRIRGTLLGLMLAACGAPGARSAGPAVETSAHNEAPRETSPEVGALGAKVDATFARFKSTTPGCAVGIYRAGKIAFARGYGMADLEHGVPNTPSTVFDLGSVSKQFTAAAILLLVQDGKVSLDDSIRKFVPELPAYAAPITLRHMLQHTSGLRDHVDLLMLEGFDFVGDVTNDDDALWVLAHQHGLNFAPGTAYSYTNSGYFLASLVVKRVTGETLAQFSKRRIFDPLGMTHTGLDDDLTRVVPNRAVGYTPAEGSGEGTFASARSHFQQVGNSGVLTTIEDLAKWDANFYEPKVGGNRMLEAMRTPAVLANGKSVPYGLGLEFGAVQGKALEYHSGDLYGQTGEFGRLLGENLSVAVLCNDSSFARHKAFNEVFAAVDPRFRVPEPGDVPVVSTPVVGVPPLEVFVGDYVDPETLKQRHMAIEQGKLVLRTEVASAPPASLVAVGARTFQVKGRTVRYEFDGIGANRPTRVRRVVDDDAPHTYERAAAPFAPSHEELEAYVGRYTSDEFRNDLAIILDREGLRIGTWGRSPRERLIPSVPDGFIDDRLTLFFQRDRAGNVTGLRIRDDRLSDLRLIRKTR